jgi:hypothetical protein
MLMTPPLWTHFSYVEKTMLILNEFHMSISVADSLFKKTFFQSIQAMIQAMVSFYYIFTTFQISSLHIVFRCYCYMSHKENN